MASADTARQMEELSIFGARESMERPLFLGREEGKEVGMEGALFMGVSGTREPEPSWEQGFVCGTENSDSLQLSRLLG